MPLTTTSVHAIAHPEFNKRKSFQSSYTGTIVEPTAAAAHLVPPNDDEEDEEDLLDTIHENISFLFTKTKCGIYFDLTQTLLSFLACFLFIVGTYATADDEDDEPLPRWLFLAEVFLVVNFILDYLLHLYLAKDNRCEYLVSGQSLIDLLAILPVIALIVPAAKIGFLRLLRGIRVLRVLRANRLFSGEVDPSTALRRQFAVLGFTMLAFMFIGAGLIYTIDDLYDGDAFNRPDAYDVTHLSFFDSLYFVIITITTVGYGDISPSQVVSKGVTIMLVVMLFILLPRETSKIGAVIERTSRFDAKYEVTEGSQHIVIVGSANAKKVLRFLTEFYHEDHGEQLCTCVMLMPGEPSDSLTSLVISNPIYEERVQYIKGSPLHEADLRRAEIDAAAACIVLSDPFSVSKQTSDVDAILCTKAISMYANDLEICIQLMLASSKVHQGWAMWHQVIVLEELLIGLLSASSRCHGLGTMLCNMITSSGECDVDTQAQEDYNHGFGQEVYIMPFSPVFAGWKFKDAAAVMYDSEGLCCFGVSFPDNSIVLNPSDYELQGHESCIAVADSEEQAEVISTFVYSPKDKEAATQSPCWSPLKVVPCKKEPRGATLEELQGHVIIAGCAEGLMQFVTTLRVTSDQAVCVLHLEELDVTDLEELSQMGGVYFCLGSPMSLSDLKTARADFCEVVVIVADMTGYYVPHKNRSVDSFGIFVANLIDSYFKCRVVVELIDEISLEQLKQRDMHVEPDPDEEELPLGDLPFTLWPRYVSGNVFFSNMLDCLLAQCVYKPALVRVITELLSMKSPEAAGQVSEAKKCRIESALVRQLQMPPEFVGKTYGELFGQLCQEQGCVVMALYRTQKAYVEHRPPLPFVLTNPPNDIILHSEDILFALCGSYTEVIPPSYTKQE